MDEKYEKPEILDQSVTPKGVAVPFAANALVMFNYIATGNYSAVANAQVAYNLIGTKNAAVAG